MVGGNACPLDGRCFKPLIMGVFLLTAFITYLSTSRETKKWKLNNMPKETVGKIPEFDDGGAPAPSTGKEEVKETDVEETPVEETETPAELPAETKPTEEPVETPVEPVVETDVGEDADKLKNELEGLRREREGIMTEIVGLRKDRRILKEEPETPVTVVEDPLKGVHQDDIATVEKIVKAKGYVKKDDVLKENYQTLKQDATDEFLEAFPEYKPENDKNDTLWNSLSKQLKLYYREPERDGHYKKIMFEILKKAHQDISKPISEQGTDTKKRIETAGAGGGGKPSSSSAKPVDMHSDKAEHLRQGGWSEEEIKVILK